MKIKTQVANITANLANAMINWQPFNHRPFTSLYDWAHKVRENDPAWIEFMKEQDDLVIVLDEIVDTATEDRKEMVASVNRPGRVRRILDAVTTGLAASAVVGLVFRRQEG